MGRKPKYSQQQLIDILRRLADHLGHPPTQIEMDADPTTPAATTYYHRFGSWNAALEEIGLEPRASSKAYDDETLLEILRRLADDLGRTPSKADLIQHDLPAPATYATHFGTWSAALAKIGLSPRPSGRPRT